MSMKFNSFLKSLLIGTTALMSFNVAYANSAKTSYQDVLPPGAKLVAGDAAKNEFFIVADNTKAVPAKEIKPVIQKNESAKVMHAVNENRHKKTMMQLHAALKTPKVAHKVETKTISKIKNVPTKPLASNTKKPQHKIAFKHPVSRKITAKKFVPEIKQFVPATKTALNNKNKHHKVVAKKVQVVAHHPQRKTPNNVFI